MRCRPCLVAFVGMLVIGAAIAQAQEGQGRGRRGQGGGGRFGFGGGGPGGDVLSLLSMDEVRTELEIGDQQKQDLDVIIEDVRDRQRERFQGFRDLSDDERRERMAAAQSEMEAQAAEVKTKLSDVLLPNQMERLQQLEWQRMGAGALSEEKMATALGLSDDQKSQLTGIRDSAREKMNQMFEEARGSGGDFASMREKMQTMRTETDQQAMAVLTADQKTKYEELLGEKFTFPERGFGPGGPGGRRGGEGRGEGRGPGRGGRGGEGGNRGSDAGN